MTDDIYTPALTPEAHRCFDSGCHSRARCSCSCSWCLEWKDRDRAGALAPSSDRPALVCFDTGGEPGELVAVQSRVRIGPAYPPSRPFIPTCLQVRRGFAFRIVECRLGYLHMPFTPLRIEIENIGAEPARFMAVLSGPLPDPGFLEAQTGEPFGGRRLRDE
jgi:hypothetical protein